MEDLLGVRASSKKPAGGTMSLGDELDGLFGAPSVPSGQYEPVHEPAVIDDMFGPMMGNGGATSAGVATTISG